MNKINKKHCTILTTNYYTTHFQRMTTHTSDSLTNRLRRIIRCFRIEGHANKLGHENGSCEPVTLRRGRGYNRNPYIYRTQTIVVTETLRSRTALLVESCHTKTRSTELIVNLSNVFTITKLIIFTYNSQLHNP